MPALLDALLLLDATTAAGTADDNAAIGAKVPVLRPPEVGGPLANFLEPPPPGRAPSWGPCANARIAIARHGRETQQRCVVGCGQG